MVTMLLVDAELVVEVDELNELATLLELVGADELAEELPSPFPKTTILALPPEGTVTTQNEAPPAPSELLPSILLTAWTAGSILHGRPLQPSPSQTISTPNSGT